MLSVCIFSAIFGIYLYLKKKSLFIWNSNFTGCPPFYQALQGLGSVTPKHVLPSSSLSCLIMSPTSLVKTRKKHITYTALPNTPCDPEQCPGGQQCGGLALDWSFLAPLLSHLELPGWSRMCPTMLGSPPLSLSSVFLSLTLNTPITVFTFGTWLCIRLGSVFRTGKTHGYCFTVRKLRTSYIHTHALFIQSCTARKRRDCCGNWWSARNFSALGDSALPHCGTSSTFLLISTADSPSLMVMMIIIMTIVDLFSPKHFIHIFSSSSSYNG